MSLEGYKAQDLESVNFSAHLTFIRTCFLFCKQVYELVTKSIKSEILR